MDDPTVDDPAIELVRWGGPWPDDDPDAGFKADVALSRLVDPMPTIERLCEATGIPLGALCRHILVRWASAGSEALLRIGPGVVERMTAVCESAEAAATDEARLEAYATLRGMVSWLQVPLDDPTVYPVPDDPAASPVTDVPSA